jgi:hypothetical protein
MYISNGKPLWYINKIGLTTIDGDLDRLQGINPTAKLKNELPLLIWAALVFYGLGLWSILSGVSAVSGALLALIGAGFDAMIIVPHVRNRRFYDRLLSEHRIVELNSWMGDGLRKFLFAGERALQSHNQLTALERTSQPLIYSVSPHPLDDFLRDPQVWNALWHLACVSTPEQEARLVAALEPYAEAVLRELQPHIDKLQGGERKLAETVASGDALMVGSVIEQLQAKSAQPSKSKVGLVKSVAE